jgi:predicted metalloprotease/mono/diheme cytochrome c family protein
VRVPAVTLLVLALAGCGSSSDENAPADRGKELFARNCGGCHTLAAAGTRGSADDPNNRERRDGPNLDNRMITYDDALFAIRNGGFGGELMPANIVTGKDAEEVARFVERNSGHGQGADGTAALSRAFPPVEAAGAAGDLPQPTSTNVGDPRVQRAAFESAQSMWRDEFHAVRAPYDDAHLVFFHTLVHTPCGVHNIQTGPFYCPPAAGVYLNEDFFDALARAYGLRSPFAASYVTAHEVGHHVQQLLGVHARVARENADDPDGENARSVLVELQADCYAGIWLHTVAQRGELSDADLEDILRAAAIVGDDFQRERAGAELAPETWTHGSSAQRTHWLKTGYRTGDPAQCDTFAGEG